MGKKNVTKPSHVRNRQGSNDHVDKTSQSPAGKRREKKSARSAFKYDYSKDYSDPKWPYAKGGMDRCAKVTFITFPILIIVAVVYVWYTSYLRNVVRTPLGVPAVISTNATSAAVNPDRFWGTYRSGLYFGMKARSPTSPVFGAMWLTQWTQEMPPPIRHWCDQADGIPLYSWFSHDGMNFGIQEIVDKYITLSQDFAKLPGGDHGGDWTARIQVNPRPQVENPMVSLFFYVALDGEGTLQANLKDGQLYTVTGHSQDLGDFSLWFPRNKNMDEMRYNYLITYIPEQVNLKEVVLANLQREFMPDKKEYLALQGLRMPPEVPQSEANFIIVQVTFIGQNSMEVWYESASVQDRQGHLSGDAYLGLVNEYVEKQAQKMETLFHLKEKGFNTDETVFAKAVLSNMLGSIGYFYGHSLVKSQYTDPLHPLPYWDAPLLTAVPSRSFFPRGFLWDEGFHNLLIVKWDMELSMDIIGHWLDLMNTEGWIPREQILGKEARARVPDQFVQQHNQNANPPTLFLPLQKIVKTLISRNSSSDHVYLERLFPRLKAWYNWYLTTQTGFLENTFLWKGRDPDNKHQLNPLTLTSGLDDYPRASHPTERERHVDLRCWMALASGVMADIAQSLGQPYKEYENTHKVLTDNKLLDELHWSEHRGRYADYGLHTDKVKLEKPPPKPVKAGQRPQPAGDKIRVVKQEPTYQLIDTTFGYVSLFPFLLKIVEPNSLKLGKILTDLEDPNLLWTNYGLRSLAKNAPLYHKYNTEHDPPYWRGAIWINMNYLALGALHHYHHTPGPYQEHAGRVYTDLRQKLIANLYKQYRETGYIWENYDDVTGKGKGSHPFTGWSALIVAIMAEEF